MIKVFKGGQEITPNYAFQYHGLEDAYSSTDREIGGKLAIKDLAPLEEHKLITSLKGETLVFIEGKQVGYMVNLLYVKEIKYFDQTDAGQALYDLELVKRMKPRKAKEYKVKEMIAGKNDALDDFEVGVLMAVKVNGIRRAGRIRMSQVYGNLLPNSTWNEGTGGWSWNGKLWERIAPEKDKPNSHILHAKPDVSNAQQASLKPYTVKVTKGDNITVSFDYKDKNWSKIINIMALRVFPAPDTPNSQANSLQYTYLNNETVGNIGGSKEFETLSFTWAINKTGYLNVAPYDNDTTGKHESWFREIMITKTDYREPWSERDPMKVDTRYLWASDTPVKDMANEIGKCRIETGDTFYVTQTGGTNVKMQMPSKSGEAFPNGKVVFDATTTAIALITGWRLEIN